MKFYVNRILLNHKGEHILDGKTEAASVPLTLGALAVEALLRELPPDNNAPSNTKIARWKLAKELQKQRIELIRTSPEYDAILNNLDQDRAIILKTEEVNLIKSRIQMGFAAVLVGPAEDAIEFEPPALAFKEV